QAFLGVDRDRRERPRAGGDDDDLRGTREARIGGPVRQQADQRLFGDRHVLRRVFLRLVLHLFARVARGTEEEDLAGGRDRDRRRVAQGADHPEAGEAEAGVEAAFAAEAGELERRAAFVLFAGAAAVADRQQAAGRREADLGEGGEVVDQPQTFFAEGRVERA